MDFAGMARSYRKIQRFRDVLGHGSRPHPPFPPKCPPPAGAGRARETIPSNVSGLFAGMAAPTETSGAFGMFAGMARSYRKIERFPDILGDGSRPHPPFPPKWPAPAVGAGPARETIPSNVSGLFAGMAAPTETSGAFGMFAGMARSYKKIPRFPDILGDGSRPHPPFPPKWPAPAVGAGPARETIPSNVSGLFAGMAAPTETSGAFGMFAGMARSYRKIERFRHIRGLGSRHHPPFSSK
jgi:hypothetical protein